MNSNITIGIVTNSGLNSQSHRIPYLRNLLASIDSAGIRESKTHIVIAGAIPALDRKCEFIELPQASAQVRTGALRNAIIDRCRDKVLILCDDDVLFAPGYLNAVSERMTEGWDILAARLLNPNGTRYWDWPAFNPEMGQTLLPYDVHDPFVYVTGGHGIYRTRVFDKVRWSEVPAYGENEERVFAAEGRKHGFRYAICPQATVFLQSYRCDAEAVVNRRQPQAIEPPCADFLNALQGAYPGKTVTPPRPPVYGRFAHKLTAPAAPKPEPADVSILVTSYRYLQRFRLFANALCRQMYDARRFEVVVANPQSPDGLSEYLAMLNRLRSNAPQRIPQFKEVMVDEKFCKNRGYLIQTAFENSTGCVAIGMDGDIIVPHNFVGVLFQAVNDNPGRIAGVYRSFLTEQTTDNIISGLLDPFLNFDALTGEDQQEHLGFRGVIGYCQAVLREKWAKVGYPGEFDRINESDVVFVDRLKEIGVMPMFLKSLRVLHLHHPRDWSGTKISL